MTTDILDELRKRFESEEDLIKYICSIASGGEQRNDLPRIKFRESATLAKFDGEYEPGKQPVEVIRTTEA